MNSAGQATYAAAFALEITEITLADLIMDLTGTDISDVPFLGTVVLPEMAVTLSTEDISVSNLLERLDSGSLLRLSGSNIRNRVAAFFNMGEKEDVPVKMTHSDSSFSFNVLKGQSFSLSSLVSQFGFSLGSLSLPPRINNILDLDIKDFSLNSLSREFHVNVPLPDNLTYFDGQLTVKNAVVRVHAILNASSSISVEVKGRVVFGDGEIDVLIRQDITLDNYVIFSRVSPRSIPGVFELFGVGIVPKNVLDTLSGLEFFEFNANLATRHLAFRSGSKDETAISFENLLQSTGGERINIPFHLASFRNVEAFGQMDTQPGGGANISFSVTYGENNTAHLLLQRKVNSAGQASYAAAFALEITEINLADLIMDLTGTDISDVPFLGTVFLPDIAVSLSTEDISISSLLERLDSGSLLHLSGSNIRNRVAAFFNMGEMEDVPIKMTHSDSSFSFDVLKGRSFSVSSLVPQFGFSLSSLSLPHPGINNILDLDIKDFSLNSLSREFHVDIPLPNNLTYFDGQLTVQNAVVGVHAILNASSSISVEVEGSVVLGGYEINVLISQDITSDGYMIVGRISPRSISEVLEVLGTTILPVKVLDTLSGLEFFEFSVNLATRKVTFRVSSKGKVTLNFEDLIRSVTEQDLSLPFNSASFMNLNVLGGIESNGDVYLSFSFIYQENITANIVLQKKLNFGRETRFVGALALEITEIAIAEIIQDFIGVDITGIPFFGSLILPEMALTLSTEDISIPSLLDGLDSKSLLHYSGGNIEKRLTAYFNVGEMDDVLLKMTYFNSSFAFDALGHSLSLSTLVSKFGLNLNSHSLPPGITDVLSLNILQFIMDVPSRELQIDAQFPGELTYFDRRLIVQNVIVTLDAILKTPNTVAFEVTGKIAIGDLEFDVSIKRNHDTNRYVLASSIDTVTLNFEEILKNLTGEHISLPFDSVSFREVEMLGEIETVNDGTATFFISGRYGTNNAAYILLHRLANANYAAGFATEIAQFNFADLIKAVTGVDISDIPFFGSLELPSMALTFSTVNINSPRLLQIFQDHSNLRLSNGHIPNGFSAFFDLGSGNGLPLMMAYSNGKFRFKALQGRSATLNAISSTIGFNLDSIPLPPGVSNILNLNIMQFCLNTSSSEFVVDAHFPNDLTYFNRLLRVQNVVIKVHAILKSPTDISIEIAGRIQIASQSFDISIRQDSTTKKYVLRGQVDELSFGGMIEAFGAALVPQELISIVRSAGLFEFSIEDMDFTFPFDQHPKQIQIAGSPVIYGFKAPYMSATFVEQAEGIAVIEGFHLGATNLADLIQRVTGLSVSSIAILDQDLEVFVLISPITLPGISLQGIPSEFSISEGVSIRAVLQWPQDCSSDAFCAVALSLIGSSNKLMLEGTIINSQFFTLKAHVSDLQISGFTLSKAGLEVRASSLFTEIGVFGSVDLRNPNITLTGAVRLRASDIAFEMTMTGCWEKAFGVDWLTICSLQVLIAITAAPLPGLAFGAEIKIGKPSCGLLQGSGFVGFHPNNPQENYYYVNILTPLTFESVLEALCININLPGPLADTGFPEGLLSSFSLLGKVLPHVPLTIPRGYRLKGTVNILGLSSTVDITIDLPAGIRAAVILPPLDIAGGLLQMYASGANTSVGPYLNATVLVIPQPFVNIEARGYVSVLGISVEALLRISNDKYEVHVQGRILGLFQANLEIYASYGSIETASFGVKGSLGIDLCDQIKGLIEDAIQSIANVATAAIDAAQDVVDSKKAVLDEAKRELDQAQAEVDRCQRKFDAVVEKLEEARRALRGVCSPPNCGSGKQIIILNSLCKC